MKKLENTQKPEVASNEKKGGQRNKISATVQRLLYTRAGGRCQLCGMYILESVDLGYYPVNLAEMAHIVGQSTGAKSPRGSHSLPKQERDEVDNLMLLCPAHHSTIDKAIEDGEFTVEVLNSIKRDWEQRIKHVTGIPAVQRTCIIRIVGRIRGNVVHVTRPECNSATLHHATPRFADFSLDYHRIGIEIDLTSLGEPEDNSKLYWKGAKKMVKEKLRPIQHAIELQDIEHLSIFGLARIPILIYSGFCLGNKVGSTFFQRRRVDHNHWHWIGNMFKQEFEWRSIQEGSEATNVALIMNISGSILKEELPSYIDETYHIFLVQPTGVTPHPDAILSVESLSEFRRCYRQWLAHLEAYHKLAPLIHLFPAIPTSAALAVGADLMPHSQPEILVYDRLPHKFCPTLSINKRK